MVRTRSLWGILVALALVLALALPAMAKGKPHEAFDDLKGQEWALSFVAEMQAKGLMNGKGNGKFDPRGSLSRAEAITVAVRLMGLEDEAKANVTITDEMLPFSDRPAIPAWAKAYVAEAVEAGIIPVSEDGMLEPNKAATRLWVSVLLVRALNFDAEAQAKMTADLSFKDANLLPPSLVGYVAAAVDHSLIQGYPDGQFQPNKPVTRAEMAALLSRTDSQLIDLGKSRAGVVQGKLVSTDSLALTLTLQVKGRTQVVQLAADAAIFLQWQEVILADLTAGSKVTAVLNAEGKAVMIQAKRSDDSSAERELKGQIVALDASGLVTLQVGDAAETFSLSESAALNLGTFQEGDWVEVKVLAGVVVSMKLEDRGKPGSTTRNKSELKGTVKAFTAATLTDLASITITTADGDQTFKVAPAVLLQTALGADLVGQLVEVKVMAGVVIRLHLEDDDSSMSGELEIKGTITAMDGNQITVVDAAGVSHTYELAATVDLDIASTHELAAGDFVEIKVKGGKIVRVRLED